MANFAKTIPQTFLEHSYVNSSKSYPLWWIDIDHIELLIISICINKQNMVITAVSSEINFMGKNKSTINTNDHGLNSLEKIISL